jgi:hypothetical protein
MRMSRAIPLLGRLIEPLLYCILKKNRLLRRTRAAAVHWFHSATPSKNTSAALDSGQGGGMEGWARISMPTLPALPTIPDAEVSTRQDEEEG